MKSTLADVAKAAKVSAGTVSSVLNNKAGTRRISKTTAERIRRIAGKLSYVPDHRARSLRTRRTNNLGLLIDIFIQHSYLAEVIAHLEQQARNRGYHVNIGMLREQADAAHYVRSFGANRCDAILAVSVTMTEAVDRQFKAAIDAGTPVVLVYCGIQPEYDCVFPDTEKSAVLAVEYLLRLGRRRIACVGHDYAASPDHEYVVGYQSSLDRHGIGFDPGLFFACPSDFEQSRALWKVVVAAYPDCNGVIAFNDDIALGLARGIREGGLTIPDDVLVVAQNNTYPVRMADAPLASTQYDLNLAAKLAIDMAIDRLEENHQPKAPRAVRRQKIDPVLIECKGIRPCGV